MDDSSSICEINSESTVTATMITDKLYNCNICNVGYSLHNMYACYHGHYLCKKCYKQLYFQGKDNHCPHGACTTFMKSPSQSQLGDLHNTHTKQMFPCPHIYSEQPNSNQNHLTAKYSMLSIPAICRSSNHNLVAPGSSKKPVKCPHYGCKKTIAVSALDSHFEKEHKRVLPIITKLEKRNTIELYFGKLTDRAMSHVLMLMNVTDAIASNDRKSYSNYPQTSRSCTSLVKPFFVLMATKIQSPDQHHENAADTRSILPHQLDRVFFFVSSNIVTDYNYTLAVSTFDHSFRCKYYGPVPTMANDSGKLYEEGKGLVLNYHQVDAMDVEGKQPAKIDVIIHEKDEDESD